MWHSKKLSLWSWVPSIGKHLQPFKAMMTYSDELKNSRVRWKIPNKQTHSVVLALPCQSRMRMPRTLFLLIYRFVSGNRFLNKMFKLLYESLEGTFKFSAKKQNKIVMMDCATRSLGLQFVPKINIIFVLSLYLIILLTMR